MLLDLSIRQLADKLSAKKTSSVEVVQEAIERLKTLEPTLHNFINTVDEKTMLAQAEAADKSRGTDSSSLHGIPFGLKDCYATKDIPTTASCDILKDYISPYNATVYNKLLESGAILVGKQSLDAFGHGGSNENTDFDVPTNAWDQSRVAGGSSGGSANAIAARQVSFSIGEDTGGSIRNPASFCNISGLKVSYGRVSRYGATAYASSLDTVGPMAKSAEDLAFILEEIAGVDTRDASSAHQDVDQYSATLNNEIKGKIIAVPQEFFADGIDPEVKQVVRNALAEYEKLGAQVEEVSIPLLKHGIPIYYMIAASETSSNLARLDGVRYGKDRSYFTDENMRRIMLGTYALSAGYADELYIKGQKSRTALIAEFNRVFSKADIILGPTVPTPPTKLGELINDPLANMMADLFTVAANIVGIPSLAIPAGFSKAGLPIGMQLMGKHFHEAEILNMGHQYQQVTDWHQRTPAILHKETDND